MGNCLNKNTSEDYTREYMEEVIKRFMEDTKATLNDNSLLFLRECPKVIIESIKRDINSIIYASIITPEIKACLIIEKTRQNLSLKQNVRTLLNNTTDVFNVTDLFNDTVLDAYLISNGIIKTEDELGIKYYERVKEFIRACLTANLKVNDVTSIFRMIATKEWDKYRLENFDDYTRLFNKVLDSLENNNDFDAVLSELTFLPKVKEIFSNEEYNLFIKSMREFYQIYHNNLDSISDYNLFINLKNDISNYVSKFIAKSKEKYINDFVKRLEKIYRNYFTLRLDNIEVLKLLNKSKELYQREKLTEAFLTDDTNLLNRIEETKNKCLSLSFKTSKGKELAFTYIDLLIETIIKNKKISSLDDILPSLKPIKYDEYIKYEKICKLINRLNQGYLKYTDRELDKYRDLISFNGSKYIYNGPNFTKEELEDIFVFKDLTYTFNKVRSYIMKLAKEINVSDIPLTKENIDLVSNKLPFNDEYFEFNRDLLNSFDISNFDFVEDFTKKRETILNDNEYRGLYNLIAKDGLMLFLMLNNLALGCSDWELPYIMCKYISNLSLKEIIEKMSSFLNVIDKDKFTIKRLGDILDLAKWIEYCSENKQQLSLLGYNVLKKLGNYILINRTNISEDDKNNAINIACDLYSAAVSRSESTVPYIYGIYNNYYRYSMYDALDVDLMTAGVDGNTCFSPGGDDNDLLHYCALNKNGFVIKITDDKGNYLGRAAGFRNGNGVYISQFVTIFDKEAIYSKAKEGVIGAFQKACDDIVGISQNNPYEENKIDFVVTIDNPILEYINKPRLDLKTMETIGRFPIENESEDWQKFISNTKNLSRSFITDYRNLPELICMSSAIGELDSSKIKKGDTKALYNRTRNKVWTGKLSKEILEQVNRIRSSYSYVTGEVFRILNIDMHHNVMIGDNWYIIYSEQEHLIIDSLYLPSDEYAKIEYDYAITNLGSEYKVLPGKGISYFKKQY